MSETDALPKPGVLEDRFARRGVENSRSLLRSADALAAIAEYGHALALVSLALEELESAHAYRLVADGVATFNPKEAHVLQFIDKRALREHRAKLVQVGERVLTFFYFRTTAKFLREEWGRKPSPDEVSFVIMGGDAALAPRLKELLDSPDVVLEGRGLEQEVHRLLDLKNRGLYVMEEDGRLCSPSDIPEAQYRHYRELADGLLEVMQESTENGLPLGVAESLRQNYAEYRRKNKRLEGPFNPDRIGDEDRTQSDLDYDPIADHSDEARDDERSSQP